LSHCGITGIIHWERKKCSVVIYGHKFLATSKGLNSMIHSTHYLRSEALKNCEVWYFLHALWLGFHPPSPLRSVTQILSISFTQCSLYTQLMFMHSTFTLSAKLATFKPFTSQYCNFIFQQHCVLFIGDDLHRRK